jgi:hypothetical protein
LTIRPYNWGPINGKSGIKAYVQDLYVTVERDELREKYYYPPEEPEDEFIDD